MAETAESHRVSVLAGAGAGGLGALLIGALFDLPAHAGLTAQVASRLTESGVAHPVTAVLLNFRGYDTLLEIAVLLLGVAGVQALAGPQAPTLAPLPRDELLDALARILVPALAVLALYLLWHGAYGPGGAFQAGAVLGAAGVLLRLADPRDWREDQGPGPAVRAALAAGLLVFAAVAALAPAAGSPLLTYPAGHAKEFILLIEATLTLSIAATLVMLFLGPSRVRGEAPP